MKWTYPTQASRSLLGSQLTATKFHDGKANLFTNSSEFLEGEITAIVTVGIDIAQNVFEVRGVDWAAAGSVDTDLSF